MYFTQPEFIGKEWKEIKPHDKPMSLKRGKRLSGRTKKVQALVAKMKRQGW